MYPSELIYHHYEQRRSDKMNTRKPLEVPLNEKRLLNMEEFQTYTGLGKNKAIELAKKAKCRFDSGNRRLLFDRVKFDKWCDDNCY